MQGVRCGSNMAVSPPTTTPVGPKLPPTPPIVVGVYLVYKDESGKDAQAQWPVDPPFVIPVKFLGKSGGTSTRLRIDILGSSAWIEELP